MAALENRNMKQSGFSFRIMPHSARHSAQPSFSLPSVQPQALVPGPSSSAPGISTSAQLTSSENVNLQQPSFPSRIMPHLALLLQIHPLHFTCSPMAAPENVSMQQPSFSSRIMPHSVQPLFSLPSVQLQTLIPGSSLSAPGPSTSAQLTSPEPSGTRIPEHLMHKNRLQEYAQRSNMHLPIYHTPNEGSAHAPKFRSTVLVGGKYYTSKNVFPVRKAAEQDAAKLAFDQIVRKTKDEGLPDIFEKSKFFKSILNEFAAKMNLVKVAYHTVQQEGHQFFVSALVFNGKSYIGDPARSKKEAEQLAARTAILSNLNDSRFGILLSELINSKVKFCAAINNVKDSQHTSTVPHMASLGHVSVSATPVTVNNDENSNKFEVALPELSSRGLQQEYLMSKQEKCPEESKLSDLSQQAGEPQHLDDDSSLKKRKKNKKKANKKPRMDSL